MKHLSAILIVVYGAANIFANSYIDAVREGISVNEPSISFEPAPDTNNFEDSPITRRNALDIKFNHRKFARASVKKIQQDDLAVLAVLDAKGSDIEPKIVIRQGRGPDGGRRGPDDGRRGPEDGRRGPEEGRRGPEEGRRGPEEGRRGPEDGRRGPLDNGGRGQENPQL